MSKLAAFLASFSLACTVHTGLAPTSPAVTTSPATAPATEVLVGCDQDIGPDFAQAVPLEATSRTTSCLQGQDVDVFRLVGPAAPGGTVIRFSAHSDQAKVSVRVHDDRERQISFTSGSTASGWLHVAPGATVYLRIGTYGQPNGTYVLALDGRPVDEPGEPNDEPATATPLVVDTPASGVFARPLGREEAVDWYRFTAPPSGKISAVVEANVELVTEVALLDGDRRKLAKSDGGGGVRVVIDASVVPGQTYFLAVKPRYSLDAADDGEPPVRLVRPYQVAVSAR